MKEHQLIYIGILLFILYLLYQCYKKDVDAVVDKAKNISVFNNKPSTNETKIINDAYIQPLNLRSFQNINEVIDRDTLDIIVFNKLKNRRSIIYSSLGVRQMLLFTYLGSTINSNNWKTFQKVFKNDDKLMVAFHRDLNKYLRNSSSGNLQFASGIWYDNQALQLTPYYKQQIACLSGCHSPMEKTAIEDEIAIKTDGTIDSFEYQSIDETLLLINAIYFEFKLRVNPKKSYIDRFVSWDGHESEVKYMNDIGHYLYVMDTSAQALLINYDNSPFSLLIILPKNGEEPEPMTRYDITETIKRMKRTKIDLYLPKIEYENVHPLIEPLESVGFSYITKSSYDRMLINNTMPIMQIVQKTKVKIVEDDKYENFVKMDNTEDLPKVFKADHSFLFYFVYMPTKECVISGIFNSI